MEFDPDLNIEHCRDVYPPSEDTFLLLDCIEVTEGEDVLEMGCGSGIISVHCAAAGARVTAVDVNAAAVKCTTENARKNGLEVNGIVSNLFSNVTGDYEQIIFNPPYIPANDNGPLALSWSGGEGGVEVMDRFLEEAPRFLRRGGRITAVVSSSMDEDLLNKSVSRFKIQVLGRKRIFFEELRVLSMRLP